MKTYTEQDLRNAYEQGAKDYCESYKTLPLFLSEDVDDYIESLSSKPKKEKEKEIPITYGLIKATCGWSKFCDVTNGNHYAINECGDYKDREVFYITESQAKQLNFI